MLRHIARTISDNGAHTLTYADKVIWNTAVLISVMTGDTRTGVPPDAKIICWGAARAGFCEMGVPEAAELVRLLVLELAYRADLGGRDREAGSASLLRIADLKRRFGEIAAEADFSLRLHIMSERLSDRRS